MQIGPYVLDNPVVCAPMAGVTDRPFRQMARTWGVGLAVSEMLSANPEVWDTEKSRQRMDHSGEVGLRAVQIAGSDPQLMADAARFNVAQGAQIIDINLGCPAKKVNRKLAGSALMKEPELVQQIARAVIDAVDVPVTLKMRTGWDPEHRNGPEIARMLEQEGIAALTVHGRTRACAYRGHAEYDTIRTICQQVQVPVIANGDITNEEQAKAVLDYTGAHGVMIGRAAQGRPWLFGQVAHYLATGEKRPDPSVSAQGEQLIAHVKALHAFYGEFKGVRIARKHVGWFIEPLPNCREFRREFNALESAPVQLETLERYYSSLLN